MQIPVKSISSFISYINPFEISTLSSYIFSHPSKFSDQAPDILKQLSIENIYI